MFTQHPLQSPSAPLHRGTRRPSLRVRPRRALALALGALLAIATVARGASESPVPVEQSEQSLVGEWRIVGRRPAPWAGVVATNAAIEIGARVRVDPARLDGPGAIGCGAARLERVTAPPEGLFEGNLPDPARDAARLGFRAGPVPGLRVVCANVGLDFHLADPWTLLLGLDDRIYTLSRAPGALAEAGAPEGAAQRLLEQHLAGDTGFSAAAWDGKREALAPSLADRLDAWFAVEWPEDEPPPINGDPLTMSQEPPTRFAVLVAELDGEVARVPVRYADALREWSIVLELRRGGEGWQLADVVDERGERLGDWLDERP